MAAQASMPHVRVDDEIKSRATAAPTEMGVSAPEAVRLFLRRVAADRIMRAGPSRFENAEELFAFLEKDAVGKKNSGN